MPIRIKAATTGSSTDWRTIKKVFVKVNDTATGWKSASGVWAKVVSGWTKMWPGNAPAVSLTDPINIRLGGYNGTVASSPQLFCSTDAGTSGTFLKLWGNDGTFTGTTPITLSNRRMLCSDNIDGQVARFSLTGNDTIDFSTLSQANRDLAEGYYVFYQMLATNVDGALDAYSPPIKVIKRKPALVSYTVLSETGGVLQGQSGFSILDVIEVNAQIRWGWWIKPGGYLGGTPLLRWWKNTSKSPGGTLLKSIDIETGYDYVSNSIDTNFLSDTNTSNVLTIYNNYSVGSSPLSSGQYIVAELYLENSYTSHYSAPVSYWGSTGAAPTISSVSLRTYDGQVDTVMDNQSNPRIVSQAYFEIVAQVADYASGTTFNFEPKFYKADTGDYLNYNSGATISNGNAYSFPTDLSPYSVEVSGTSATVIWRTYINSNFLPPNPTYGGGQAKYQFNFRLSATKSGGSASYYTGLVSSNHAGNTIYPTYMNGDAGGSIDIHPHTQGVLSANNYSPGAAPKTVRFSVTGDSYPSGNASYPRSYGIDFGDGNVENIAWPTGTSNPSYTTWDHTYTTNGTFTARLITVPQGFTNIGTRQRSITLNSGAASPTFLTATTNRNDGVNLTFGGSSDATGYDIFWNTSQTANPSDSAVPDFTDKSSPFLDTTISALATRWYWVRARNSLGTSPWYPAGDGVTGTRIAVLAPTAIELAPPVVSRTNNSYIYSTTNGGWNNSPTSYSYQWKAQTSLPYPPYYNTVNVGTDSSSYTSSSTYNYWSIYCVVTASNSGGSANATSNSIQNTPVGDGPSGISVTLTPTGTQQARTTLTANVSVTSGTSPITYSVQIFKKTGANPTNADTGLESGTTSAEHYISDTEASGTPDRFIAYGTATNSYGTTTGYSNVVISTPYVAPTTPVSNSIAPSISPTTGNAGVTTYSSTEGVWNGTTPIAISYQWQYNDQGSLFLNISGATSSTYSPPANFFSSYVSPIRCKVTATNADSTATAYTGQATVSPYVAPTTAPSGGGVTLTPSGTQQAGTQICANVTAMSGTSPISYLTTIRKATGQTPTGTGTPVSSGSGTGNSVCCHTITANEASGTPDHFKAYTVGSNSAGDFTVGSNIVISTPAATTTTTADPCLTCNSYSPSNGTYPYTTTDPYGNCASGSRYYRICVTPSGCANREDYGSCVPVTTTTTAAPTTTTVNCNTCDRYIPDDGTYPYTASDPYGTCTSGSRYYRICYTPAGCPNTNSWGGCVPAATTTTTAAPTTTTTAGRPTVYWKCSQADVNNANNPCYSVGSCRQAGNTYFPSGCTSCCD